LPPTRPNASPTGVAAAQRHFRALVETGLVGQGSLPLRFVAGTDAMAGVEQNLDTIRDQISAHRDLSASLAYDA
jgi:hypothetical protein